MPCEARRYTGSRNHLATGGGETFQYGHGPGMDMNGLVTTLDAIAARSDCPVSQAKISSHFGRPGLNVNDPNAHSSKIRDLQDRIIRIVFIRNV